MSEPTKSPLIFVSYSHQDKEWLDKLMTFGKPLVQQGRFNIWDNAKISVGAKWLPEIKKTMEEAELQSRPVRCSVFL